MVCTHQLTFWSSIGSPKYVFWQHLLFVIAVYINTAKSYFYETKPEDKSTCMYQYHILFLFEWTCFTFSKQRLECLIYITKKLPHPFTRSSITSSKRVASVISPSSKVDAHSYRRSHHRPCLRHLPSWTALPLRRTSLHRRPWRSWRPRKQIITREGSTCPKRRRRLAIRRVLDFPCWSVTHNYKK